MKVITFSTKFPAKHPRKGEPTFFVEKVWRSLGINLLMIEEEFGGDIIPKHHTIRVNQRFIVGEYFSPRVWSDKPYASKQIEFAPPIQIKKIWNFQAIGELFYLNGKLCDVTSSDIPLNDGLSTDDFLAWFDMHPKKKDHHFAGQILCWNDNIIY